ncbi:MAG: helix-turn-helix domain-containing protein [Fimbriimonadaceae bacterium]|nr:helix-turn-helix domain-containing protein [Fimbriimonadaceae bacterium]
MKRQTDILNLTADHLRVLASSACNEVMSSFHPHRPMSAREAGEIIDRSSAAVLEQVQKLLEVGLLIEAGTRKRRSRTEQLYLPAAKVIRFQIQGQTPEVLEAYMGRVRSKLKVTERNMASLLAIAPEDETILDFLIYKTYTLRLNRERALRMKLATSELLDLLKSFEQEDSEATSREDSLRFDFTVLGLPTSEELRRRWREE